jgi:hypothetical protein
MAGLNSGAQHSVTDFTEGKAEAAPISTYMAGRCNFKPSKPCLKAPGFTAWN